MNINVNNNRPTTFNGGIANIVAVADNHGDFKRLPLLLKTVKDNAEDIFQKAASSSTRNIFVLGGDWFINPAKKGFLTKPNATNGDLQNAVLNNTIQCIENVIKDLSSKFKNNATNLLETIYVMGNHCLDAGDDFILNIMKKNPMVSLITNVDLDKSPAVIKAISEAPNKIVKSKVYEIQDDKNPYMKHKVLFVGATVPSMGFYNPGLLKGMEFYGNCEKKDSNLTEADLYKTTNSIKFEVENFKKAYPKGVAVLVSHMGNRLSEFVCKEVPLIDHVLNGHDHKNTQSNVGNTSIDSLGKDNEMFKSLTLEFDDDGNLIRRTMTPFFTNATVPDGIESHPSKIFLDELLSEDKKPLISLFEVKTFDEADDITEIDNYTDKKIGELIYGNEIRYKNSYLMNYLTTTLKDEIIHTVCPDLFSMGLQSSIVRCGIKDGATNLDIMKLFDGVSESLAGLCVGNVTGEELVGLISENVQENLKAPTRNSLIHWSDVQVNRTLIQMIENGSSEAKYEDAVLVRNPKTLKFEPIDLSKDYKIALGKKFLIKDDIEWAKKIRHKFTSIDRTCSELFNSFISNPRIKYKLAINSRTKEQRIL